MTRTPAPTKTPHTAPAALPEPRTEMPTTAAPTTTAPTIPRQRSAEQEPAAPPPAPAGAPEIGAPEIGAPEIGAPEVGAPEVGARPRTGRYTGGRHRRSVVHHLDRGEPLREGRGGRPLRQRHRAAPVRRTPRSAATTPAPRTFRPDIEGLRAVAVVTVVLSHAGLALPGGFVGVDVFFVISGFLITGQLDAELRRRGRIDFARFYARRLRRIVPAATLVLLATLLASWAWLSPLRIPSIVLDGVLSAVSGVNWRFAANGTDYFQVTAPPSPFQHYWSLSVEEQFYLAWPLLLLVVAVYGGRLIGRQRAVVGTLLAALAGSFLLSVTVTAAAAPVAYFGSHTRVWELALGALIAVTAVTWYRVPVPVAAAASWLGLGMILWSAASFSGTTPYPGSLAAVPVLGAALVIVGGSSAPRWGAELLLAQRPMQLGGLVSYSWYLWHWPLLLLVPAALDREPGPAVALAAVAASLGLAAATYVLVERPYRRNTGLIRHPQRAWMIGAGLVGVSCAAALTLSLIVVVPGADEDGEALPTLAVSPESVVQATRMTVLPADLTPSLESAQRDQANSRNCFTDWFDTTPDTTDGCVFGDPKGTKTMVLLGDSHAAQWAGPIFAWASASQVKAYYLVKASCPAGNYPDLIPAALQRVYTECNEFRTRSLQFIAQLKPQLVVIGSLSKGAAVKPEGMTETVSTLRADGAEVLYIADNPYMGIDPPSCLAQHPDSIQRCAVPRTAAGLETPARLGEIKGAEAGGARVWDPVPFMCADVCPSVIGNVTVYKDENHLTNTFTRSLLPELAPILTDSAP